MTDEAKRKRKFAMIITAYPLVLILIGLLVNLFIFGVAPAVIALPSHGVIVAMIFSAALLLANHIALMTRTELTRLKYNLHATPEEWAASDTAKSEASALGLQELERHHNAHTNATENTVYFGILAGLICIVSPVALAAQIWSIGFALGRLGHALSYLAGHDGLRGVFMSVSLASLYGMASYLIVSVLI